MMGFCCTDSSCVYCQGTGFIAAQSHEPGHYWAKHVSGIRDPEVVWIGRDGMVQIIGDDYSYEQSSFEIIGKVVQ
jgi:hypothetical protein